MPITKHKIYKTPRTDEADWCVTLTGRCCALRVMISQNYKCFCWSGRFTRNADMRGKVKTDTSRSATLKETHLSTQVSFLQSGWSYVWYLQTGCVAYHWLFVYTDNEACSFVLPTIKLIHSLCQGWGLRVVDGFMFNSCRHRPP